MPPNHAVEPTLTAFARASLRLLVRLTATVPPTAGDGQGADGGRAYSRWNGGKLMSGRLNRFRVWGHAFPAACGGRTRGSN